MKENRKINEFPNNGIKGKNSGKTFMISKSKYVFKYKDEIETIKTTKGKINKLKIVSLLLLSFLNCRNAPIKNPMNIRIILIANSNSIPVISIGRCIVPLRSQIEIIW